MPALFHELYLGALGVTRLEEPSECRDRIQDIMWKKLDKPFMVMNGRHEFNVSPFSKNH